jgi:CTP synthase
MKNQIGVTKKGGTMRLGGYECRLTDGSLIRGLYGVSKIVERHRHRLEIQNKYIDILEKNGMKVTGKYFYKDENGQEQFLPEMIELDTNLHPYFVATQSHPEMLSRATKPHPLFVGLLG